MFLEGGRREERGGEARRKRKRRGRSKGKINTRTRRGGGYTDN